MARSHPRVLTLSPKELLVLELLREQDSYGLQLVAASKGRLKRGTVYVTLGRMEEKGYITSRLEDNAAMGGLPRRQYQPTALRRRAIAARLFGPWTIESIIDPTLTDIDREYTEATRCRRKWRGRWILMTGH